MLGGAIVLILLGGGIRGRLLDRRGLLRAGLWAGLAIFIGVGLGVMFGGGQFLEYPRHHASNLILLVEIAALVSIGLTLGALFFGGKPTRGCDSPPAADP